MSYCHYQISELCTFSKVLSAKFMLWFCPAVRLTRQNIYIVFSGLTLSPHSLQTFNHSKCKPQSTKAQNHLHKSNTPLANPQHVSTNPDINRRLSSKHTHFSRFNSVLSGPEPKVSYCLTWKYLTIHTFYVVDIIMASEYFKSIV